jgi:hypothetical protein
VGPLDPEVCRRLACDATVARVLITHHPTRATTTAATPASRAAPPPGCGRTACQPGLDQHPGTEQPPATPNPLHRDQHLVAGDQHPGPGTRWPRTRCAGRAPATAAGRPRPVAPTPGRGRLPAAGGRAGHPGPPAGPAQRPDGARRGCGLPDCSRPLAWCEAHHLVPWLQGGPTDLAKLVVSCRAITGRSTTRAGGSPAAPTAGSPPTHPRPTHSQHHRRRRRHPTTP